MAYSGWSNYQTWNVALWLNNDPGLYEVACKYVREARGCGDAITYPAFLKFAGVEAGDTTPDGTPWRSTKVDRSEIVELLIDLV
jgi:hypothetical protein